jgi:hypothetical protein
VSPYRTNDAPPSPDDSFWRQLLSRAAAGAWAAAQKEWVWGSVAVIMMAAIGSWLVGLAAVHVRESDEARRRAREAAPCRDGVTERACSHPDHRLTVEGEHIICRCSRPKDKP